MRRNNKIYCGYQTKEQAIIDNFDNLPKTHQELLISVGIRPNTKHSKRLPK